MKSLGLNYSCWTLIVIDKTPVARTNGSRLAPLQAALQEEEHSDRGGNHHLTIQSEEETSETRRVTLLLLIVRPVVLFKALVYSSVSSWTLLCICQCLKPNTKYVFEGRRACFANSGIFGRLRLFVFTKVHRLFKADTTQPTSESVCLKSWRSWELLNFESGVMFVFAEIHNSCRMSKWTNTAGI